MSVHVLKLKSLLNFRGISDSKHVMMMVIIIINVNMVHYTKSKAWFATLTGWNESAKLIELLVHDKCFCSVMYIWRIHHVTAMHAHVLWETE